MIYNWKNKYGTIKTSIGEVTTNDEILNLKKELNDIKIVKYWVDEYHIEMNN